jgi:hypothetical protein
MYHAKLFLHQTGSIRELEECRSIWKATSTPFDFVNVMLDNVWEDPEPYESMLERWPFEQDNDEGTIKDMSERWFRQREDTPIYGINGQKIPWNATFEEICGPGIFNLQIMGGTYMFKGENYSPWHCLCGPNKNWEGLVVDVHKRHKYLDLVGLMDTPVLWELVRYRPELQEIIERDLWQ